MSIPPSSATTSSSVSSQFTYGATATTTYFPLPFHLQQQAQPYAPTPQPQSVPIASTAVYAAPVAPVPAAYPLPQFQQAQQLFQRDAQILTPEALEGVKAALANSDIEHKAENKKKAVPRKAAGQSWEDPTLTEWPENDFRLFCGDLGNEVVRDKRTGKTKGYGFVSFANPSDLAAALKEMNGKYVGNRPIKLRKSNWKERIDYEAVERQKNYNHKKPKAPKKGVLHK